MISIPAGKLRRKFKTKKTVEKKNTGFFDVLLGDTTEEIEIEAESVININPFNMGKYPMTNREYMLFKPDHKGKWSEPDYPVESVSWYDAIDYCNWLSDIEGLEGCYSGSGDNIKMNIDKNGYRLPTEAEWEYACRARTETVYYWGDEFDKDYCWAMSNSGYKPHPVGQRKPNPWGLYDMSGNVWEWCWDWYDKDYYGKSPTNNPTGTETGKYRVNRGGSWYSYDHYCSSSHRGDDEPKLMAKSNGFRIMKTGWTGERATSDFL